MIRRLIILLLIVGCDLLQEEDCAGVAGGDAVLSGCDNICNSTAVVDDCGVCGGDGVICEETVAGNYTATTDLFYLVDGDSRIRDDFEFEYEGFDNKVYLWKAIDGVYGYSTYHGGLKLFPKNTVLNAGDWGEKYLDSTITISNMTHELIDKVATSHLYNTSPLHTWRAIFREYIKQVLKENSSKRRQIQLKLYLTYGNRHMPGYAWYAKMGANAAYSYYEKHKNSPEKLMIINDFDKLSKIFYEFNYLNAEKE